MQHPTYIDRRSQWSISKDAGPCQPRRNKESQICKESAMHEILDTGKCVVCCTACISLAAVGAIAALAAIVNLIKIVVF